MITNNFQLPAPLVQAVTRHPRERVAARISVTELIQPPQIRALTLRHESQIREDASDRLWALMGTLLHGALEVHAQGLKNLVSEGKLTTVVNGWEVVGHYDLSEMLLDGELLTDYKLTSVWSVREGVKPEWEAQTNLYAELLRRAGRWVNGIQIVAIGRDWSKMKAQFDKSYPQQQVAVLPVPLWTSEEAADYLEERVRLHQEAAKGNWPECTPEERWAKPTQYALMKTGQKKAVKLFDSQSAAEMHVAKGQYVQERPGTSTRCESYCSVNFVCKQYAAMKAAKSETSPNQTEEQTT
jgi:hypothetical protein